MSSLSENVVLQPEHKKKVNVSLWRQFKRKVRAAINWNEWPLRWQMISHIVSLIFFFFVSYIGFMVCISVVEQLVGYSQEAEV
jgi:hypothetical protein